MADGRTMIERDDELARVRRTLATREGGVAVVMGPPGIGRSTLLRAAAPEDALRATGRELERSLPFGVTVELLRERLARLGAKERARRLEGTGALVGRLLDGSADGLDDLGAAGPSRLHAHLHALTWVVGELAEDGPVVLVVDDVQWADDASLRWLAYLAARLEDVPVKLLLAAATGPEPLPEPLTDLVASPSTELVQLAPLTLAGVTAAATATLGVAVEAAFARACADSSGGNPFLLSELLLEVQRRGLSADADSVDAVRELRPEGLRRRIGARVRALDGDARRAAEALAVLETGRFDQITALAQLEPRAAGPALDRLVAADIVTGEREFAFVHALVRQVVTDALGPGERARLHGGAAVLLQAEGAGPERLAPHLLRAPGSLDPAGIDTLRAAAAAALVRGTPAIASALLRRASEEPAAAPARASLLAALGSAASAAGEPDGLALLITAANAQPDAASAARLRLRAARGLLMTEGAAPALELLEATLVDDLPAELADEIRATMVGAANLDPSWAGDLPFTADTLLGTDAAPRSAAERGMLAAVALRRLLTGETAPEEAAALALRAYDGGRIVDDEGPDGVSVSFIAGVLLATGELERDREVTGALLERARRSGSLPAYASAAYLHGCPLFYLGEVAEAHAWFEVALDARRIGWNTYAVGAIAFDVRCLIALDRLDDAARLLAEHRPGVDAPTVLDELYHASAGRLALARGDARTALECARRSEASHGPLHAVRQLNDWRLIAAEALARDGATAEALALAEEEVAFARRHGGTALLGAALRVRARARDRVDDLEEAVTLLREAPYVLERIDALIDLAVAHRRGGDRARAVELLDEALDAAARRGARAAEARARAELNVAGRRPRRTALRGRDALTAAELRVCTLAMRQQTNREIAGELFVTVKTVEKHLASAYPKLGISSRRELADALG